MSLTTRDYDFLTKIAMDDNLPGDLKAGKIDKVGSLHSDRATDPASASNFRNFKIRHLHLDLDVQFHTQCIHGIEIIKLIVLEDASSVILDVHMLDIHEIKVLYYNSEIWELTAFLILPYAQYGSALHIKINKNKASMGCFKLMINFKASDGPGITWLEPQQTAGKKKPFFYTQGQTIFNRSFFPCQDTPAVKSTYSANVKVPAGFTAVMSAPEQSFGEYANLAGDECFYFNLPLEIPVYLIALAVGDLISAPIGPRSHVWAEPCMLAKAKDEFDDLIEDYLQTGEELFGPYVWNKYDLLIMPPSFPFGGMENSCLTFITPFLLVGDKSLTFVIMHEIAHSWFGNLITNATWSDFWLNEGFTMYAQRRIEKIIEGPAITSLEMLAGRTQMKHLFDSKGEDHPLHKLRIYIDKEVDPEDSYNEVAYEKGCYFVMYLESLAGSTQEFDKFLRSYIQNFQFKSIVAEDMIDFYLKFFPHVTEQNLVNRPGFEFSHWLNTPGLPPYEPDLSAADAFTKPAKYFAKLLSEGNFEAVLDGDVKSWPTLQLLFYLDEIYRYDLPENTLEKLQDIYPFLYESHNMEIQLRWCLLIIKNNHSKGFSYIKNFLRNQGKIRFTLPVYRALNVSKMEEAKQFLSDVYRETKPQLHPTLQRSIETILLGESNYICDN